MKMSPFAHAGKIAKGKIPLLLIHGENVRQLRHYLRPFPTQFQAL